jgi:hypothetical protein
MSTSAIPAPEASPSVLAGLTIRKGRRGDIAAHREMLLLQRTRQEGRLEFLDERVLASRDQLREAESAAFQARLDVVRIDGLLAAIDAALAAPEAPAAGDAV